MSQDAIAKELDTEIQERVTAAKLLQGHVADLLPSVLKSIEPITEAENRDELERKLGPWLAKEVALEVGQMIDSRELLEEIVREILKERARTYQIEEETVSKIVTEVKDVEKKNEIDDGKNHEIIIELESLPESREQL